MTPTDNEILAEITEFVDKAHGEQTRKYSPDRYIVHPLRVMKMCSGYTMDNTVLAAALLHDVLEDTPVTQEEIETFLQEKMSRSKACRTVALVRELTDEFVRNRYPKWNRRVRKTKELERMEQISAEAQTIKYADIIDNCTEIVQQDRSFARVFVNECQAVLNKLNKGNAYLRQLALKTIENCQMQLATG